MDYQRLEVRAFEMEAEIASLKEDLAAAIEEKEGAFIRQGILDAELDDMAGKLKAANLESKLLHEAADSAKLRWEGYESRCKEYEDLMDLTSKEKEEMAMQLTDALLELEAEKSTRSGMEKDILESKVKTEVFNDEIANLSRNLAQVKLELQSYIEQCRILGEKLSLSEEHIEQERQLSFSKSSEISQLRADLAQLEDDHMKCEKVFKSNNEMLSSDICKLKDQLGVLRQERDALFIQLKEVNTASCQSSELEVHLQNQLLAMKKERDELLAKNIEAELVQKNYADLLLKKKTDAEVLAGKISSMEVKIRDGRLSDDKEKMKLRMRLRSTQAKLDMYRGRYRCAVDEMTLMDNKFKEASVELKKKMACYGSEILRLKKELSTRK